MGKVPQSQPQPPWSVLWKRYWELKTDCLNLVVKEILYRFFAFCLCHLDWSIGNFAMTAPAYYDDLHMLGHNAVGPSIHNNAVKRTHMLSTFRCNNLLWLEKTGPVRCILEEMLEEADNWEDEKVTDYATFMRPRYISERWNEVSERLWEQWRGWRCFVLPWSCTGQLSLLETWLTDRFLHDELGQWWICLTL